MSSSASTRPSTDLGSSLRYRTVDLVTIATLAVALGVTFWVWGKAYGGISALAVFSFPPSVGVLAGPWLLAGVVGGLIVRRPGAALVTELAAAAVSALVPGGTEWGLGVLASGLVQGLGAELVLALFLYRRFSLGVAVLAGAGAGAFGSVYEWFAYWEGVFSGTDRLIHLGLFALSGAVVAGAGGWLLVRALARAGVLDAFGPGRELHERTAV
ncbi:MULTISPECIES: ECF transporter S component [unclassified Aeromicrobium]|jgi:energy-coupling factor transport system substrate-specific component|uniref:ECF transporter S component n=1 Tax=unclassified Aeromicrobium TaxID=2633570 RepID=UPI000A669F69|nr:MULTISPECIES: ECF transporter S component [unclassified Aeromicrobium]